MFIPSAPGVPGLIYAFARGVGAEGLVTQLAARPV